MKLDMAELLNLTGYGYSINRLGVQPVFKSDRLLEKNISFILADSHASEGTEALLSFWGEPFMAEASERQAPRFIFHVQKLSELLPHLVELDRCYRRHPVADQ